MRAYAAIMSARFRMLLQYRAAAIAGFACQLFWGFIRVMVFEAFYRSTTVPQPMRFEQVVTYVWLGQALLMLLAVGLDADVRTMIRTGSVAYELLRPLDLYALWYCRDAASRLAPTLLRAVPMFVLAGVFFGLRPPPTWASAAGWIVTTAGALLLGSALSTLVTISLLWTISGEGIARLAPTVVYVLSGMLVPLPLFPSWARSLLEFLPFAGVVDAPFRVYIGHIPPDRVGAVLALQLAWTVALIGLGRALLAVGTRRLVIQGG